MLAKGEGEWGPRELTNSNNTELSVYPLNKPIFKKPFKKLCILHYVINVNVLFKQVATTSSY